MSNKPIKLSGKLLEIEMDKISKNEEAEAVLRKLPRHRLIKDFYEEHSDIFITLHPSFEYPEWDQKTVGEFLGWLTRFGYVK